MQLFLYDSLKKKKRIFTPIDDNNVRVYACGPTVYNYAHVGNARMAVVCDLLIRVLRTIYKNVKFVSNITDIDDKIIEASISSNIPIKDITDKFSKIYNQDMLDIDVMPPTVQPKATNHIPEMIKIIKQLIKNDCAYISSGNVLFDVEKYKYYGILSGRNKEEQIAGSRIEIAKFKKNPQDFILWKPSKNNEPSWDSPWGKGRPGWHIECSAMSEKCLGIPFDIHCGGVDLTFPHHENEIAQSCSLNKINCHPTSFCNYWFHNGFVTYNGEKMSKSLGNIQIINKLLKFFSGQAIRLSLLSSHYRQPLDWSEKILNQSEKTIYRLSKTILELGDLDHEDDSGFFFDEFNEAIYDDLNTPKSLGVLNKWFSEIKKIPRSKKRKIKFAIFKAISILGLDIVEQTKKRPNAEFEPNENLINKMINERNLARKNNQYEKADQIREDLKKINIELEDTPNGTLWKKTKI
ncbi:MAG: cysteine--tRNA ligase [Rickettsiales bacterium]|nr:cysteine--tRNA ligase [Rickettsiales bacterium]